VIASMSDWKATQFELETAHGRFAIMTSDVMGNAVQRTWSEGGVWRAAWVGTDAAGFPRRYPNVEAAIEAVGAELARLDSADAVACAPCSDGYSSECLSECLEATRG